MEYARQTYGVVKASRFGKFLDPQTTHFRILMIILIIIVICLIALYIKTKVAWDKLNPIFFNNGIAGTTRTVITGDKFYKPTSGNSFTMFFWLYVEDLTYRWGEAKNIFVKGKEGYYSDKQCPGVYISPKTNDLEIKLSPPNNKVNKLETAPVSVVLHDFPVKKWFSVGLVVNNNDCEIYLDGKLAVSKPFSGNIEQNHGDLIVGGGTGPVTYVETNKLCRGGKEDTYKEEKVTTVSAIDNLCQNRDSYNRKNVKKVEEKGFNGMLSSLCYFPAAKKASFIALKHSKGPYTNSLITKIWHKLINYIPEITVNVNGTNINKYIDSGIKKVEDKLETIDDSINAGLHRL